MTKLNQKLKTNLLFEKEAFEFIAKPDFQKQWDELHSQNNSFSTLQSKSFVTTWYATYSAAYEPIVCVSFLDNKIVGLLFLAQNKITKHLIHAGANEAEYHGWLAVPEFEVEFLRQSLNIIKKNFNNAKWQWQWIPPKTKFATLKKALPNGFSIFSCTEDSPVWDLRDKQKLKKLEKSRSLKSKMKRFQRKGNVVFEIIENTNRLKEVLEQVIPQYDFRQEAAYGTTAFEKDTYKKDFTIALFESGAAHACVLWLDEKVLAFHFGCKNDKRVCLGVISYNPTSSKDSPGTLLILELAKHLTKEGYYYFDLTPGANSYKSRFANDTQLLSKPTIYFNKSVFNTIDRFKKSSFHSLQNFLLNTGYKLAELRNFKLRITEFSESLSNNKHGFSFLTRVKNMLFKKEQILIYKIGRCSSGLEDTTTIGVQKFEDMMSYKDVKPFKNRRRLLQSALQKFSNNATFYSVKEQNQLSWYGWCFDAKRPVNLGAWSKPLLFDSGFVIGDFYQNSKRTNQETFASNIDSMLSAIQFPSNEDNHLVVSENNFINKELIENWDLQLLETKSRYRLLYFLKWETQKNKELINKQIEEKPMVI